MRPLPLTLDTRWVSKPRRFPAGKLQFIHSEALFPWLSTLFTIALPPVLIVLAHIESQAFFLQFWPLYLSLSLFLCALLHGQLVRKARREALRECARKEAALLQAQTERDRLAAVIAEKERFLSAAYHDLHQPLSTIGLYVRIAQGKLQQGACPPLHTELSVIENATQDIALMFKGVRDTWQIGCISPDIETLHLGAMLDDIERELRERAEHKGLRFRIRKPHTAWVRSNRTLLKRALSNLISNAIKYTERGGILVGAVSLTSHIRIDVCDTGIGIPDEFQQQIFEEYFQVRHPYSSKQGLGLGLAIVRRIERSLPEHHLRFASKLGRGSRFSLSIPIDTAPKLSGTIANPAVTAQEHCLTGKYIVVIEDERPILEGLLRTLAETGCLIEGVNSVAAARQLFAERDRCPDALITDFLLSHAQTGLEAVAALREYFEWAIDVPVLFVSADLDLLSRLNGYQGAYAIHHKPIDTDILLTQLCELLRC
jgi:signal transduction histidine kinase